MVSSLVGRNGIVSLCCLTYCPEDEAIQNNKRQNWNKYQGNRICNQNIIPGIAEVVPEFSRYNCGYVKNCCDIFSKRLIEKRLIRRYQFRA